MHSLIASTYNPPFSSASTSGSPTGATTQIIGDSPASEADQKVISYWQFPYPEQFRSFLS